MIERLSFENFRLFRKATVDLEQLTVLVGPNGSGKSTVLEGLACLSMLTTNEPRAVLCGARHPDLLLTRGSSGDLKLQADGSCGSQKWHMLTLLRPPQDDDRSKAGEWSAIVDTEEVLPETYRVLRPTPINRLTLGSPQVSALPCDQLRSSGVIRFEMDKLAAPGPSDVPTLEIGKDGSGLAAVLAEIATTRPDDRRFIVEAIRTIVPSVQDVRLQRAKTTDSRLVEIQGRNSEKLYRLEEADRWGYEIVFDCETGSGIPASCISEGTLIVLAILSLIMQPNRPNLLLIENLEQGLHPKAIGDLVSHLRSLFTQYPQMQVVATSHSPYLIDQLRPEEVRLTYYDKEHGAICVPLKEHPEFDRWKDAMSPGEFWSSVGEKWVKDKAGAVHD